MISPTTAMATLWGIWLVGWLITAGATAKTVAEQSPSSRLTHSLFVSIGALLLFFRPHAFDGLMRPLLRAPWTSWAGVALVAIGLAFASWARFHLGRLWSGRVTLKEDHAIIRSGPYAIVRHPIYTGLLLAFAGTALAQTTLAAVVGFVLVVIGLTIKIRQEERLLTDHFGAAYDAYRADVRALIPYVW
ncbi:MAG TPA: isoprenylcysteine carboxylmethyltransferase family protein [Gemmatimonadaceae bacterium]|nr:isoprenylcysteine carboxylmethyltransferase family protein [Gemmatimonadaceae bacterium]